MSWNTSSGWETGDAWLDAISIVVAPILLAIKRSRSGLIVRSFLETRYHDGTCFQAAPAGRAGQHDPQPSGDPGDPTVQRQANGASAAGRSLAHRRGESRSEGAGGNGVEPGPDHRHHVGGYHELLTAWRNCALPGTRKPRPGNGG